MNNINDGRIAVEISALQDIYIAALHAQQCLGWTEHHVHGEGQRGIEVASTVLDFIQEKVAGAIKQRPPVPEDLLGVPCYERRCGGRQVSLEQSLTQAPGVPTGAPIVLTPQAPSRAAALG
jgi:hypothetical protein